MTDTIRTANKAHTCYLCDRPINAGDQYVRRVEVRDKLGYKAIPVHQACLDWTVEEKFDDLDWKTCEPKVVASLVPLSVSSPERNQKDG